MINEYVVSNGTSYPAGTSVTLMAAMEDAKDRRVRVAITYDYGDTDRGCISRSTGINKIPLLVKTSRSLGGEPINVGCVTEIRESKGGKVLWRK